MSKMELLNNIAHKDLKVRTEHSAAFGDNINTVPIFPTEFAEVQREYPIFFRREADGAYQAVALLGLDKGENLFLDAGGWRARYVPAFQGRGPFGIGFQRRQDQSREPVIHVDLDHPRISRTDGEPVFLPHGGNSPYLERVRRNLDVINAGLEIAKPMFAAYQDLDLIDHMKVEIALSDRVKYDLPDFYSISQERLGQLGGEQLERLNRQGFLHLAMLIVTSLGNVNWLIELKNRRRAQG